MPKFNWHFVSVRYNYFHTSIQHKEINQVNNFNDYFINTQLSGRFSFSEKIQLFYSLPFVSNKRIGATTTQKFNGLGDASVFGLYTIKNTTDSIKKKFRMALQLGLGIKLPTGNYSLYNTDNTILPISLQPGTGSIDVPIIVIYTQRFGKMGYLSENNFWYNTKNKNNYAAGNRFSSFNRIFYWYKKNDKLALIPSFITGIEYFNYDLLNSIRVDATGGYRLTGGLAMDVFYSRISIGVNAFLPILENLGNDMVTSKARFSVNLNWFF